MKLRLVTGSVIFFLLIGVLLTVIRPVVKTAREALSDSIQDMEGIDARWRDLGVPESFTGPVEDLPEISQQILELPEEMLEGLTLFITQDGETLVGTYFEMTEGGVVETMTSAGNKVALIPVARQWETTDGVSDGCSSKFRITKADPWTQDDHFYLAVEFIDRKGERTAAHTNYMSPEFMTEWVVDVEEYSDLSVPWCGFVVITVRDDLSDPPDLLSQKHQVQVKVLTFCDCP